MSPTKIEFVPGDMSTFTACWFGEYNTFKTFLLLAMLNHARQEGLDVQFWNTEGEEGYDKVVSHFPGMEQHIYHIRDYKDFRQGREELEAKPIGALGIDSFMLVGEWFLDKWVTDTKLPGEKGKDGESGPANWMRYAKHMANAARGFRRLAKRVAVTCPVTLVGDEFDVNKKVEKVDMVKVPTMWGSVKHNMRGWFDFAGFCETTLRGGELSRKLHFEPMDKVDTKARLKTQITKPIKLPEGPGAWEHVLSVLQTHLE